MRFGEGGATGGVLRGSFEGPSEGTAEGHTEGHITQRCDILSMYTFCTQVEITQPLPKIRPKSEGVARPRPCPPSAPGALPPSKTHTSQNPYPSKRHKSPYFTPPHSIPFHISASFPSAQPPLTLPISTATTSPPYSFSSISFSSILLHLHSPPFPDRSSVHVLAKPAFSGHPFSTCRRLAAIGCFLHPECSDISRTFSGFSRFSPKHPADSAAQLS